MVFKINDFQPMKPSPNTVTALPDVVSGKKRSVTSDQCTLKTTRSLFTNDQSPITHHLSPRPWLIVY